MSNKDIWNEYKKLDRIGFGTYSNIYKAQNIKTKNYVAIKEIDKEKYNSVTKNYFNESEIFNKINTENSVKLKETFETKEFYYIVMEYCICNLEECLKMRENPFSIEEIKNVLIQLNEAFKIMKNEKIIHRDLKPSNLLISLNKTDKCLIKLSDYGSSKLLNNNSMSISSFEGTPITMAPEILKGESYSEKSDIWSLGIIIQYMLFKEYPYNGINEITLFNDINSGKKLKLSNDNTLNDLMVKMLKIDVKERISWDEYFNHHFFYQNKFDFPNFNFICEKHSKNISYYCKDCKNNICNNCLEEHKNHYIIHFSKIGLSNEEIKK